MAGRLAAAGMSVAIAERGLIGGTCVNTGCKPTKTLVASAYAAHLARRGADFGVVTGDIRIDMARVHARSQKISADSRASVESWLRGMERCTLLIGHARLESARAVRVGDELIEAGRIFINVSGHAEIPELPGLSDVPYFTNSSLLATDALPARLVIVGGSYVGLEFAQIYRRFGAEVTIVQRARGLSDAKTPRSAKRSGRSWKRKASKSARALNA